MADPSTGNAETCSTYASSTLKSSTDTASPPKEPDSRDDSTSSPGESDGYLSGIKLYTIVVGLCIVVLLAALDTAVLATAIPTITTEMHSIADVGWYGAAYLLTACSLQPLSGKIYTQFSMKYTFLVFLASFELGSLVCAIAKSSKALIFGRAIAGMGSGGLFTGSLTIMAVTISLEQRAFYLGIISSMYGVATVIGPLLGGVFTEKISWRWCFYINLPFGLITAILISLLFHPPKRTAASKTTLQKLAQLDLVGCALFIPGCVMLLLALQWGGHTYGWGSARILGLLIGCVPILALFVYWQHHQGAAAMIPLKLFTQRTVASSYILILFQMGGMLVITYYLPIWFQAVKGASPTMSGVMGLPIIISQLVFSLACGLLVGKLGYYTPFLWGGCSLTIIGLGLMSTFTLTTPSRIWIGYQIIAGTGRGMMMQMPLVAIQTVLPMSEIPIGTSLAFFFQLFGGSLFVALGQTMFAARLGPGLETHSPGVEKQAVVDAGAAGAALMGDGIKRAYNQALMGTFYLALGVASLSLLASLGVEWRSVKTVETKPVDEEKT